MTREEQDTIFEVIDILRALGGSNGFSNLQPKIKHSLLKYASKLKDIVEKDIRIETSTVMEDFNGETVYE